MWKIIGIGGIFFKSENQEKLKQWYSDTLWFSCNDFGVMFQQNNPSMSLWSPFPKESEYFSPSEKDFMINFVVDDIESLTTSLQEKNVEILSQLSEPQWKFIHFLDPEGNKIELWEPLS